MKILFLSEFFPKENNGPLPGGSEARTYYLSKELVQLGHSVTVTTAFLPGTLREDNWDGVRIKRVGPRYAYVQSGSNISRLSFAISCLISGLGEDFDIVDANNTAVYLASFLLAKVKFKKVVYFIPDVLRTKGWVKALGLVNGLINAFNERLCLLLGADKIIALSSATARKIPKASVIIYPGIKLVSDVWPKFPPKTIISVSRLVDYKRADLVIRAMALLRDRGLDLSCIIIGKGNEKERLIALIRDLKLEKKIKFLSSLSDSEMTQQFSQAQIFCLASEIEGFGIVTLEAMSFGIPFVNSNILVHREIAEISEAGLLFGSGDENDLANKLYTLATKKKDYERLSQNALKFAQKHTWKKVAEDTLRVYKSSFETGA